MRKADPGASRARAAFTLLEVMAAFLIFAVLFTVLAGTASQAFRSEGINRRRLEASLLADQYLARLEEATPEIGEETEEEDIFLVTTSVSPLTTDILGIDLDAITGRERDGSTRDDDADFTASSILSPNDDDENSPLLRIELAVEWEEGNQTLEVRRSTIALDTSGLSGFPGVAGGGESSENTLGGGDEAPDDGEENTDDAIQRMIEALQGAGR